MHKDFRNAGYRDDYIDFINFLYNKGHHITLWTSRGDKEDDKEALRDTEEILTNIVGLKYHRILKKPFFDILVDDKAVNSIDALKKMFEKFQYGEL